MIYSMHMDTHTHKMNMQSARDAHSKIAGKGYVAGGATVGLMDLWSLPIELQRSWYLSENSYDILYMIWDNHILESTRGWNGGFKIIKKKWKVSYPDLQVFLGIKF